MFMYYLVSLRNGAGTEYKSTLVNYCPNVHMHFVSCVLSEFANYSATSTK